MEDGRKERNLASFAPKTFGKDSAKYSPMLSRSFSCSVMPFDLLRVAGNGNTPG